MRGSRHRLPPLVALRAFEAAAQHLSFTRAAAELGVTHGAISHQVRGLEAYLGFALFRRLPRRLVLTEAGEALFTQVRTAFDLLEMTTVQVMAAYTKRPLVVSCIATFSMRWLMPRLHQFKARHPDIDIHLCAPDSPVEFPRDDITVSIRTGRFDWPEDIVQEAFLDSECGPVCSPDLVQRCPLVHPEDLRYHTLLHTEFLFRDSTQFTGLRDCQARAASALDFHFNASLATLNLVRAEELRVQQSQEPQV